MIDPATLAEAAQGALDRFGELTVCAEFGIAGHARNSLRRMGLPDSSSGRPRQRGVDAAVAVRRRPPVRPRNAGTRQERVTHDEAHPDRATEGAEGVPERPPPARST
jgi:hypothetical protein